MPKKAEKKKLVLLDSHAIIHRAYHALPEFATSRGEPTGALYGLSTMLIKMLGDLKPDYVVAAFDLAGPTHRHEAYDAYKSGRAKTDDALHTQIDRAQDLFRAWGIPIYSCPGFEADDIIGTIAEDLKKDKNTEIVIASGDMDTLQLVDGTRVQVYTLKKGIQDTVLYDEKAVAERFGFPPKLLPDFKGLRGDPSDNIVGIAGIGEKTATTLITEFGSIENIYKTLKKNPDKLRKAGIKERIIGLLEEGEEEAIFSKTLATIRTDAPINFSLPQPWRECVDMDKVSALYTNLEFRTMTDKVKKLLGEESEKEEEKAKTASEVSEKDEKELPLMLWVADSNFTNPSMEDVYRFTKTNNPADARKVLEKELEERGVREVYEKIEKPLIPIVEEMHRVGVKVDKKLLEKLSKNYHKKLEELEKEIWEHAGEEFNINSPKVLSKLLYEKLGLAEKRQKKTPTGALSTKESELVKLRDKHPIVQCILDYRELSKLLGTYIDAIPPLLDEKSRLHPTFILAGAATGRMASQNPGVQNIPIKTELGRVIRNAFVAEEGCKLLSLDYSQIELRLAAMLSGDEKLIEIFKNGEDVHAGVAARVFGVSPEEVTKAMRIKAKTINFGILYGMGVNALKTNLGTDRKEAQEFYNQYFSTFTGLTKYLDQVKEGAEKNGYTETVFGRKRYFSGFRSPLPYVRAQAERMAINAPLQGTSADLIKIAMREIDEYLDEEKLESDARLLLQVHDELVYEVREEKAGELAGKFKEIMERGMPADKARGVPLVVEAHIGDNWGETEPIFR